MSVWMRRLVVTGAVTFVLGMARAAEAHSGPPYPIISNQAIGNYSVSVWTDPDTTDDGTKAGKFWVTMYRKGGEEVVPAGTTSELTLKPTDRQGAELTEQSSLLQDASHQYAVLLLDHEGPYHVHVAIAGPLGPVTLESDVQATYDLRPARWLLALYVLPFALAGFLWVKLLLRRRRS
jgi:hypothetical protein